MSDKFTILSSTARALDMLEGVRELYAALNGFLAAKSPVPLAPLDDSPVAHVQRGIDRLYDELAADKIDPAEFQQRVVALLRDALAQAIIARDKCRAENLQRRKETSDA